MVKAEALHELYEVCKDINFEEADRIVVETRDEDEKRFLRSVTDFVLQEKQRRVVAEKRF